ncbi:hypothetical protein [Pararhizobium sp. O133]|uniref:hypothetical protein n=1 Tax=Pararhizobium sp. O133 TaxID=3449278 RepID=UPI003F682EEA
MSLLSKAFSLILRNWPYYLLFCVLDLALTSIGIIAISQWNLGLHVSLTAAMILLWLAFLFFILRASILQNQPVPHGAAKPSLGAFVPFVAKGFVLYLIVFAICAPVFFAFAGQAPLGLFPDATMFGPLPLFVLAFFAGTTLVFSSIFALLGTWLPATVHGIRPQFSDAAARGSRMFWRSFFRILPLLIVFPAISWGVTAVPFPSPSLFPTGLAGIITVPMIIETAVSYILSALFATVMMVALSENYFDGERLLRTAPVAAS